MGRFTDRRMAAMRIAANIPDSLRIVTETYQRGIITVHCVSREHGHAIRAQFPVTGEQLREAVAKM